MVDLVKKATCSGMDIQNNRQYLLMGASGSEVTVDNNYKSVFLSLSVTCCSSRLAEAELVCSCCRYRLPLDSEAVLELWPTDCSSPECTDYITHLEDFALNLQLLACS